MKRVINNVFLFFILLVLLFLIKPLPKIESEKPKFEALYYLTHDSDTLYIDFKFKTFYKLEELIVECHGIEDVLKAEDYRFKCLKAYKTDGMEEDLDKAIKKALKYLE